MSYQRQAELKSRFDNTPVYRETIREAMMEKVDLEKAKQIMLHVREGKIRVTTYVSVREAIAARVLYPLKIRRRNRADGAGKGARKQR
jgi:Lhr-like helicase